MGALGSGGVVGVVVVDILHSLFIQSKTPLYMILTPIESFEPFPERISSPKFPEVHNRPWISTMPCARASVNPTFARPCA